MIIEIRCKFCNRLWKIWDTKRISEKIINPTLKFVWHHTSYTKDITIPLCGSCHVKFHNKYKIETPYEKTKPKYKYGE